MHAHKTHPTQKSNELNFKNHTTFNKTKSKSNYKYKNKSTPVNTCHSIRYRVILHNQNLYKKTYIIKIKENKPKKDKITEKNRKTTKKTSNRDTKI